MAVLRAPSSRRPHLSRPLRALRRHRGGVEAIRRHRRLVVDEAAAGIGRQLPYPVPHRDRVEGADLDAEVTVHAEVVVDEEGRGPALLPLAGPGEFDAAGGTDPGAGVAGGALEPPGPLLDGEDVAVQRAEGLEAVLVRVLGGDGRGEEVAERDLEGYEDAPEAPEEVAEVAAHGQACAGRRETFPLGRFAMVSWVICSWSLRTPKMRASGVGGQPGT